MNGRVKLKQLLIDRVDLVDKGDNPEAHISLFKRDQQEEGDDSLESILIKVIKRVGGLFKTTKGDDKVFDVQKFIEGLTDPEAKAGLTDELAKLKTLEEELDKKKGLEEELETLKKQLENEDKDPKKKPKPGEGEGEGGEDKDVTKGLPEEVKKMVEGALEKAKQAEEQVAKLKSEALEREYIEKARTLSTKLSLPAEDLGPILKRIADQNKDDFEKLEAVLKAADEAVSKSEIITKELGAAGGTSGGNAWAKVEAAADEMVVKSGAKLSKEEAITLVLKTQPELYKEYQGELQEGV